MKRILQSLFTGMLMVCFVSGLHSQCANNLANNGGFESGMENWWSWHDNNPDAYSFSLDTIAYAGDSSVVVNVLVDSDSLTAFQGGQYNNRPDVIPVTAGVTYNVSFALRSTVPDADVNFLVRDEFDNWATIHSESFTVGTEWQVFTTSFTPTVDRADVHLEFKVYNENLHQPYSVWLDEVYLCDATPVTNTCANNLLDNPSFEAFQNATTNWWSWHGGTESAFSFYASDDAFYGDSSAVIEVLIPTDDIPSGPAEYNSRPMITPIAGGEFYEVHFAAKSTVDQTNVQILVRDEFDSWATIHSQDMTITTEWAEYSFLFQADVNRDDVHLELKIYNAGFDPYAVHFDEVAICPSNPSTATCAENLVTNPGAENGMMDWWTWHGGEPSDYEFAVSDDGAVADSSLVIQVLKPTVDLIGAGQYNSRPQVSPVVDGQNYKVSVWAKSDLEGANIQVLVKDEFDGWTTLGNDDFTLTTDWEEYIFIFASESDRDDVHLELKVFTDGATAPYNVWFDEMSICETDEEPGSNEPEIPVLTFGALDTLIGCSQSMAFEFSELDMDGDNIGWEMWDGSSDDILVTWVYDPVLPYSGTNSVRVDVPENQNVANLHHRFGDRFDLEEGVEYSLNMWIRADVESGDTVRVFARTTRDTDWKDPGHANFMVLDNTWKNFSFQFTPEENFNNAFVEVKAERWNGDDFTNAYTVWYDDIQLCSTTDTTTVIDMGVGFTELEKLNVQFNIAPNPIVISQPAQLIITSEQQLDNTVIRITDVFGKTINEFRTNIFAGTQHLEIPTDDLPSGLFFVNIQYQEYIKTMKLQVINHN